MIRNRFNFVKYPWFRDGIRGAVVNLIISGSGLFCLFWFSASASLSSEQVSLVPGVLLVYVVPLFLIGYTAGILSYRYHFGKAMMTVAALLGSSVGFLVGTAFFLPILEKSSGVYHEGLPLFRNAGWVALVTTLVGIVLAAGIIILTGSIGKAVGKTR